MQKSTAIVLAKSLFSHYIQVSWFYVLRWTKQQENLQHSGL